MDEKENKPAASSSVARRDFLKIAAIGAAALVAGAPNANAAETDAADSPSTPSDADVLTTTERSGSNFFNNRP